MRIRYDKDADAVYITLREEKIDHTKELDDNTVIDFNAEGHVIGVELLFVKENNPDILNCLHVENILVA